MIGASDAWEFPQSYKFLKDEAETVGGTFQVTGKDVKAFSDGGVGWGVAHPTITILDGRQLRRAGVQSSFGESGGWKLIQLHASFGVTNEQAFGLLFQT